MKIIEKAITEGRAKVMVGGKVYKLSTTKAKRKKTEFIESRFVGIHTTLSGKGCKSFIFEIGIETVAEVNARAWRKRSNRTQAARKAVSWLFAKHMDVVARIAHYIHHSGKFNSPKSLVINYTRLGGKQLDRANLGTATKAVEDSVCMCLGIDDGDIRYYGDYHQNTTHSKTGVRIEIIFKELP